MHDEGGPARPRLRLGDVDRAALDRLTRAAAAACGAPVALLSLLDGPEQHVLSQRSDHAPLPERFPAVADLCGRVAAQARPVAVEDVRRLGGATDPARLEAHGVRAYLGEPLLAPGGGVLGVLCVVDRLPHGWTEDDAQVLRDLAASAVSEVSLRASLREARRSRETTRSVLATAMDAVVVMDARGRVTEWNRAAEVSFGWAREEALGVPLSSLVVPPEMRAGHDAGVARNAQQEPSGRFGRRLELEAVRRDGSRLPVELTMTRSDVDGEPRFTGYLRDISERRALEDRLAHLAYHDPLTGLLNRAALERDLADVLAAAQERGEQVALLYLDVDDFKDINDAHGHGAGDRLLAHVADVLRAEAPAGSLIARHGGDEFMVVLHGPGVGPEHAVAVTAALRAGLAAPLVGTGEQVRDGVGASLGVSLYPSDAQDAVELLAHADAAMYRAKRAGRGGAAVYDARTDDPTARLSLLARLRRALADGALELHYQPIVDLRTGAVVGVESLARWEDPLHGRVGPDVFVPLAESGGLVVALGELVVDRAVAQLAAWRGQGLDVGVVTVNVSARHLRHGPLLETLDAAVARHSVPYDRVAVELTESAVMEDPERTVPVLQGLRERGVPVSVDDFGTGYSSLGRLLHLPVDGLKLDRSFVDPLPDPRAGAVVEAVARLAEGLGLYGVAEGIETAEQQRLLVRAGWRYGQGYHLARPLPPERLAAWARPRQPAPSPAS
ncbi:putative bifunctional diguanylate cyclase/phosphodiesterase [Vallicoccus soli]|uniref:putative bifunctional diguanylate cyclase/phosphodiesterase n=1 Tax=Vallicoccus soli TaxID=2339232 RepID=UPI001059B28D|nr:EAL domain-containing protein [Vallicoccus soli]